MAQTSHGDDILLGFTTSSTSTFIAYRVVHVPPIRATPEGVRCVYQEKKNVCRSEELNKGNGMDTTFANPSLHIA